jgi:DNA-binding transcriptional LysR family regulator
MEIHQLRYFIAVAEYKHFTKAAEALHIAQPSVSQQIQKLEAELGSPLLHRMKRGVTLTEAGQTFLPWARRIVGDLATARAEVAELASLQRGSLAIGATPSLATRFLPAVVATFNQTYPGINFRLREAGSQPLVASLLAGEIDLALLILPVRNPSIETELLFEEPVHVGVPRTHHLAERSSVSISELRGERFVLFREDYDLREMTLNACHEAGFEPRAVLDGGEMDSVLHFVHAGLGIALLPSIVFDERGPVGIPLLAPRITRAIGLAHRHDRVLSASARAFVQEVRDASAPFVDLRGQNAAGVREPQIGKPR